MTKSVAILGCGPAGLLAAHAAVLSGWDFRIYSRKQKSKLYGAQYLHQPIPTLDCGEPRMVRYVTTGGSADDYRRKVYGPSWDVKVSPETLDRNHAAWDIRAAYEHLWLLYSDDIKEMDFSDKMGRVIEPGFVTNGHDLVISSIPRTVWAEEDDVFEAQYVWALGDTEKMRVPGIYRPQPFEVILNADSLVPWYRVSNIFGFCTMEWPLFHSGHLSPIPPHLGASQVVKPLRHNSKAAADFVHIGRYGKWEKGVLSSDAFTDAMRAMANDSIG